MKKKNIILGLSGIVVIVLTYFIFFYQGQEEEKLTFAEITRGDLNNTITSTGTLSAISTVDVGTQVSGKIDKIFVDYNSNVKKGQILAILDTIPLALQVRDANSNLEKTQAQYEQASAQFDRNKVLYEKGFLSELDFISSKTSLETALSDYHSAETALQRAKTNLSYAYIYSPIRGKIINKSVEEGQTVAASFSAPVLFQIAEDLSKMQILASVDESDIGQIKVGQETKFTVQAYPDKQFSGYVVQIRLNSQVVQNVVNYTVVVHADNKDNMLLPGMTATIDFYVEQKNNVLLLPNAALKFQPSEQMIKEFNKDIQNRKQNLPDSSINKFRQQFRGNFKPQGNRSLEQIAPRNVGKVWYKDENGKLRMSTAILGITDGIKTEIVRSKDLKEGMKLITGLESSEQTETNSGNLLNPNRHFSPRRGF
jgi:HlyD family secretion protein